MQSALLDLGYKLPHSKGANGTTDGVFGPETARVVAEYQRARSLQADGIAGPQTIGALDKDLAKKFHPPPQLAPPAPPPAVSSEYVLGTADPTIRPDPGAGPWNSKPLEFSYVALREAIIQVLPAAFVVIGDDAVKHMGHYLGRSGTDYTIDLEDMVSEVQSAKQRYEREVSQAQRFVEGLPVGTHDFTSSRAESGYNRQAESKNWFFATGGYATWGKGRVAVTQVAGQKSYRVDFEYKFFDRYNWDAGKAVTVASITITDQFMGEFHRQGLAREYNCYGSFRRTFSWRQGEPIAQSQLDQPVGGRA